MNAVVKPGTGKDYVIADIKLAEWGRKELNIAETEMPGLMAIREEYAKTPAAQGRAHRRLPAHDDPDRDAHRDAAGARRAGALGLVQHLLDAGSRGRRDCRQGHAGVRREGRDAQGLLGIHPQDLRVARVCRCAGQHDPRRRRRRDVAAASRHQGRDECEPARQADERRRDRAVQLDQGDAQARSEVVFDAPQADQGRDGRDDHRRASPLRDAQEGRARVPRDQRQRLGDEVASSTTSTAAASRWSTRSSARPT